MYWSVTVDFSRGSAFLKYWKAGALVSTNVSRTPQISRTWWCRCLMFCRQIYGSVRKFSLSLSVYVCVSRCGSNPEAGIDRHAGDVEGSEVSSLDDVAKQDAGMYGIVGALDRLNRLATVVRRFLTIREGERVLDFAVKQPSNDFRRIISSTIQFLYPTSAESLRAQLVDSIVYRRQRILWRRRNNQLQASSKGRDATGRVPKFSLAAECPPVFESPSGKSMITCGYCLEDLEVHPEAINDGMKSSWRFDLLLAQARIRRHADFNQQPLVGRPDAIRLRLRGVLWLSGFDLFCKARRVEKAHV